jgi:hypothetical protein
MKKLIYAGVLLLILTSCNHENNAKLKVVATNVVLAPPPGDIAMSKAQTNSNTTGKQDISRKIIKEGEISFQTKNIAETRKAIYNSLQKLGGYIAEENESNDTAITRDEYVLKARIPEKNFDLFLTNVSANATKVDSKNIRARDVTAEYIDISTHLANKKKLEERYVELLQKGSKIADLLEIENKINEIEATIDSTQAQLNYLTKQVDYSSLDITFYTKQAVKDNGQSFDVKLITALSGGWDDLGVFFFGCLAIWPLWIIAIIAFYVIKGWLRKHPLKKAVT